MKTVTLILFLLVAGLTVIAQNPRCKGINKQGKQCSITVGLNKEGYCRYHDTTLQCGATRANGVKCKMPVEKKGERCRFHQDQKAVIFHQMPHNELRKNDEMAAKA